MIRFQAKLVEEKAKARKPGYAQAVEAVSTKISDEIWEMSKKDYELIREKYSFGGPGMELKKLLKMVGITAAAGCKCNQRAKHMDEMGCQWCRDNIETIVDWLQEEAENRKMLFLRAAAKMLVNRAIRNADIQQ